MLNIVEQTERFRENARFDLREGRFSTNFQDQDGEKYHRKLLKLARRKYRLASELKRQTTSKDRKVERDRWSAWGLDPLKGQTKRKR